MASFLRKRYHLRVTITSMSTSIEKFTNLYTVLQQHSNPKLKNLHNHIISVHCIKALETGLRHSPRVTRLRLVNVIRIMRFQMAYDIVLSIQNCS